MITNADFELTLDLHCNKIVSTYIIPYLQMFRNTRKLQDKGI